MLETLTGEGFRTSEGECFLLREALLLDISLDGLRLPALQDCTVDRIEEVTYLDKQQTAGLAGFLPGHSGLSRPPGTV